MKETLFYVFGIALAISAVATSFIGLKVETFPGKAMPLVIVWFAILIAGAGTFAVLNGKDEDKTHAVEYKKAWAGIHPIQLEYQRSEMLPQFATIATPSEVVVTTSFTLELGDAGGEIHFCIPYSTLEPIRDVLYSTLRGDSNQPDQRWINLLKVQIQAAEVELVAEPGHAPATVERRLAVTPGDFIELGLGEVMPETVCGVPRFGCRASTANGRSARRQRPSSG